MPAQVRILSTVVPDPAGIAATTRAILGSRFDEAAPNHADIICGASSRGRTYSAMCAGKIAALHHQRAPDAVANSPEEIHDEVGHEISTNGFLEILGGG